MLAGSTLGFLKSLKKHNDKSWFDEHRKEYETAKLDMAGFVQSVIDTHAKKDASIALLKAKDCMFRINRDIRFAKDKTPYKTNFGAFFNPDGRKAMTPGYYLHIEPGKSFAGGGLYDPSAADLKKVRQEIDYNLDDFKKIIDAKKFRSVYAEGLSAQKEYKLSRVPQGFDKDSAAAPFLMYKSYIAFRPVPDDILTGKKAVQTIADAFSALQPLLEFLRRNIQEV